MGNFDVLRDKLGMDVVPKYTRASTPSSKMSLFSSIIITIILCNNLVSFFNNLVSFFYAIMSGSSNLKAQHKFLC